MSELLDSYEIEQNERNEPIEITADALRQLAQVRETGAANMLSINEVYGVADGLQMYNLAAFAGELIGFKSRQARSRSWMDALNRLSDMVERASK